MKIDFSNKVVQWVTLIFLAFIWGSSFILMKKGLISFTPEEIASYRVFCVALVLLPFVIKYFDYLAGKRFWIFFLAGIFGSLLPYFFFVKAQTHIDSSLSGILNSTTPIFTLLLAVLVFKQTFKPMSVLGVIAGFVGAAGLIAFRSDSFDLGSFSLYAILPVIAASSYGVNVNLIKMYLQDVRPMAVTSLSFFTVGIIAGVYLFGFTDFVDKLTHGGAETYKSLGFVTILAVVGTALCVYIFNMLIKETSALFASSVTYMIPVFAIFWGVLDGENFNAIQAVFAAVILLGVSLINSNRKFKRSK